MTPLTQPRRHARALLHTAALACALATGVIIAPHAASALEPQVIEFRNPRRNVDTGDVTRLTVEVVEGNSDATIVITVVGGCEMINANQALITDATRECNVTAHSVADETYAEAYSFLTMNPRRVDQAPLTGNLSGSGVYGDNIDSFVSGGSTPYDITYQYNANCVLGEDLGGDTARHVVTGGEGNCVITATRPGDEDYRAVSTVMTMAVHPAILDVNAGDLAKITGDDDPALPWSLSGFVNGDTSTVVSGVADCDREAGEAPGAYEIGCNPASLSADDYTFASGSHGSLTITARATPSVTAASTAGTRTTIDALSPFGDSFRIASFDASSVNGATITVAGGTFTYMAPATFAGADSFTYTVADQFGNHTAATVTLQVAAAAAPDPAPTPPADTAPTPEPTTTFPTPPPATPPPTADPSVPAAEPAQPGPVAPPTDGALPATGSDARTLLLAATLMVLGGLALRRASRTSP
ncbi:MAG: Calx-beta protein [Ilumatobacteraceae bacterium]|nr:Calx-beta protein [Ilumatobacteraceae bacterium]